MFPHRVRSGRLRTLAQAATAVFLGWQLIVPTAVPAAAADDSDSAVTWSVQPADEAGPDGRPWIEDTLDPGASAVEHLAVRNFSDHQVDFGLAAADGVFNPNGRFNILPPDTKSTGAGTWIAIADSVTVPAGQTVVVPFTITVPPNAEPGDHAAGVAASIMSTSTGNSGASVGIESRVGFRVMTRVTGDLVPGAKTENLTTSYHPSWNPFAPGDLTVEFDVVNTGNTRLRVTGQATAGGHTGAFPPKDEPQELLVGDSRHFSVTIADVWPSVLVPVSTRVAPEVVVVSGVAPGLASISTATTAVAVPWPQAILLVGIALIVVAVLMQRRHSKRRLDRLLEGAREEARRDALQAERTP